MPVDLTGLKNDSRFKALPKDRRDAILAKAGALDAVPEVSSYQKYFAQPATSVLGNIIAGGSQTPGIKNVAQGIAGAIVPQNPAAAGADLGLVGAQLLGPEAGIPALIARMAGGIGGGALGGALSKDGAGSGALQGGLQTGLGEVAAPVANLAGRMGKKAINREDIARLGSYIKSDILPSVKSPLKTAVDMDRVFRGQSAEREVGKALKDAEGTVAKQIGGKPINAPSLLKFKQATSGGEFMDIGGPIELPDGTTFNLTPKGQSFKESLEQISKLNDIGYGPTGSTADRLVARNARATAHTALGEISDSLKAQGVPQSDIDRFMSARTEFSRAKLMQKIFGEPGVFNKKTRSIDIPKLQELVQEPQSGYREDLVRSLGPEGADRFLGTVFRGAPPVGTDIPQNLNALSALRVFGHPSGGLGMSAPIEPRGLSMGHTIGAVPRRIPKIPPLATDALAQSPAYKLLQSLGLVQ